MSIVVSCDRADCKASFQAGLDDGHWSAAPQAVTAVALGHNEESFGGLLYVYLPEGWKAEVGGGGLDEVIHCPAHATTP